MKTYALVGAALATTAMTSPARAFADLNFDATKVAPDAGSGDPLPSGWYNVQMDESGMKPTNDGLGAGLNTRYVVLDGQYKGRKLFHYFNLKNENQQTVEIAQKQLSAVCHAVGVLKPAKSEELHGKALKVKVGQKPASGGYDAGNKITSFKNINEQVDMAGGDAGAAAFGAGSATPPPAADGAMAGQPWATGAAAAAVEAPAAPAPAPAPAPATTPPAPPPAAPPAPPAAPAAPAHDPMAAALADGWIRHPSSPPHLYKGSAVKTDAEVTALYPAPTAPAAPSAPDAPPAPPAAPGAGETPPWVTAA